LKVCSVTGHRPAGTLHQTSICRLSARLTGIRSGKSDDDVIFPILNRNSQSDFNNDLFGVDAVEMVVFKRHSFPLPDQGFYRRN